MPKIVNYASRIAFLREAAFELVHTRGVEALSRRALAAELGVPLATVRRLLDPSASLAKLAADEVASRWRLAHLRRPRPARDASALDRATFLATELVPANQTNVATWLVWLRLELSRPKITRPLLHDEGTLAQRFHVAERGFCDPVEPQALPEGAGGDPDPLDGLIREHDEGERRLLAQALDLLDPAEPEAELRTLSSLVHGLVLDVVLGTVSPPDATQTVGRHLAERAAPVPDH